MTFTVRLATLHDAEALQPIILHASGSHDLPDYFAIDGAQLVADSQADWIKCFLVENDLDRQVVGFCIACVVYDTWVGRCLTLSALFVKPEYRQRYVCSALVTAASRYALQMLNAQYVDCTILVSNLHAARVLQSLGFYNLTEEESWVSYRLDQVGFEIAINMKLRPEVHLEGFRDSTKTSAAYIVRLGTSKDAQPVFAMVKELAALHDLAYQVSSKTEMLAKDLDRGICGCLVAMNAADQCVIGFATSWLFVTVKDGKMAHLEDIYVRPESRGLGIGKALMVGSLLWAQSRGAVAMDLRVQDGNTSARGMYKAMGFEEEAVTDFRCIGQDLHSFLWRWLPAEITFSDV